MDDDLANYPGLYQRGGKWYLRRRVPAEIRHLEGREQVRLSLETSDRKTAIKNYAFKLAEIEGMFEALRKHLKSETGTAAALRRGKLESLSRPQIDQLARSWWAERERQRRPEVNYDPIRREEDIRSIDQDLWDLTNLAPEEGDPIQRTADQLLLVTGVPSETRRIGSIRTSTRSPTIDRSTAQYHYLCGLIARALPVEADLAKRHILGQRGAPNDPLFNPVWGEARDGNNDVNARHSVADLISAYRSEREIMYGKESTDRKYGLLFRAMEEVWGPQVPVHELDRQRCVKMLTFLERLPPNATKRFPKLNLTQAVEFAEATNLKGLAPNTVSSYMQNLTAILKWAEAGGWGVKAHTDGLVGTRRPQVKRRGFAPSELKTLFTKLELLRDSEPGKYWVPALAVFTGARAGEICQLRVEDLEEVNGIPCLNLSEFGASGRRVEGKRLKTAASERYVPLHPQILTAGFIQFARKGKTGHRLFPEFKPKDDGSSSRKLSSWFGRFKRQMGFNEPALVFHSFRHGFRDACRDADISVETAEALGGWAGINQATKYGARGRVELLDRALRKISYGDFSLRPYH